jgi:UDP-N-acetylmuramate dehydrogenase
VSNVKPFPIPTLRAAFGDSLQEFALLANYTTAHVGGPAAALLPVHTADEMEKAVRLAWELDLPFVILGSGSNVLASDAGYPGLVVINRARNVKIDTHHETPTVWAESGANLGTVARQAALRGLGGLEWAAPVPGTVGGAVYGNAGAHGGDTAGNLIVADILHRSQGREAWTAGKMEFAYRTSCLKKHPGDAVILAARFQLNPSSKTDVQARMEEFSAQRRRSQPPGASMGSMFKNPPGDYAGRLIESAGLKGARSGAAEISPIHANFFVNLGGASAADLGKLIALARRAVLEKTGVRLELEVELLGDWPEITEA